MRIEVLWQEPTSGLVAVLPLELAASAGAGPEEEQVSVRAVLAVLPGNLRSRVESGELGLASHGQTRSAEGWLKPDDRLELLAPITMDARAARAARVKQVRAKQRGPYNRNYPDPARSMARKFPAQE